LNVDAYDEKCKHKHNDKYCIGYSVFGEIMVFGAALYLYCKLHKININKYTFTYKIERVISQSLANISL